MTKGIKTRRWLFGGILTLLLVLFIGGGIFVSTNRCDIFPPLFQREPSAFPAPAATHDERWQQDLAYLASELPRLHRNAFFSTSRTAFDSIVATLHAEIPTLTDEQIITRLSASVASIGDGHTQLNIHGVNLFPQIPIGFYWTDNGLVVTSAHPDYSEAVGTRLVQIGETDVLAARDAVIPLIAYDNAQHLLNKTPMYLRTPAVLYALGVLPSADSGEYTFERPDGGRFTLTLTPVADDLEYEPVRIHHVLGFEPPLRLQNNADYWYIYLEDSQTIYFQYNRARNSEDLPFADFNADMFTFIDANPVQRLILDVRFNGGGNSSVLDPFFEALRVRPSLNTRGHLYTLIGRSTFSSAMMNAIRMKTDTNSILLGESTGGKPNGYGEVRSFTLPNSGLEVQYSTRFFCNWDGGDLESFPPDIEIALTMNDLLTGRDPLIEAAIAGVSE